MTRAALLAECVRMICDRCMDARHWRCGGRAGCTCSLCVTETPRSIPPRKKQVRRDAPPSERRSKPKAWCDLVTPPSRTFTAAEIRAAADVIAELGPLLEHCRIKNDLAMKAMAKQMQLDGHILRRATTGELPQGMTQQSALKALQWIADHWK